MNFFFFSCLRFEIKSFLGSVVEIELHLHRFFYIIKLYIVYKYITKYFVFSIMIKTFVKKQKNSLQAI